MKQKVKVCCWCLVYTCRNIVLSKHIIAACSASFKMCLNDNMQHVWQTKLRPFYCLLLNSTEPADCADFLNQGASCIILQLSLASQTYACKPRLGREVAEVQQEEWQVFCGCTLSRLNVQIPFVTNYKVSAFQATQCAVTFGLSLSIPLSIQQLTSTGSSRPSK